ncbi:hypothetical protein HMPREF9420_2255 [Segatella salivae DSM 15606]|uniref:Uncharacterized protein n=1 Tax=Segatella salivae DSM 15606 TaxID=888832 RepID=E6MRY7_9BACT|nr:hypothetical protein HMPREF9420_2255 [Segatella salivae DSM 15606]
MPSFFFLYDVLINLCSTAIPYWFVVMIRRKKLVGKVEIAPRFHWVGEQPKLPFFVPHIQ